MSNFPKKEQPQKQEQIEVDVSWMEKDKMIWIEQLNTKGNEDIFEQGILQTFNKQQVTVKIKKTDKQQTIDAKLVYERASDYNNPDSKGYEDMVNMEIINDAELLKNIEIRYKKDLIFTYVGPTLLVVNPFGPIPSIVGEDVIKRYVKEIIHKKDAQYKDQPAHVYALSAEAFKCLFENQKNQSIVISGESGAGKTESAKLSMNIITSIGKYSSKVNKQNALQNQEIKVQQESGKQNKQLQKKLSMNTETTNQLTNALFNKVRDKRNSQQYMVQGEDIILEEENQSIEEKIVSCNPVLESFGNAKTVRNDNSSRFGKYVKMSVESKTNKIKGAKITNYLLEKSRLISKGPNERNFHILYMMITQQSEQELEKISLAQDGIKFQLDSYKYLKSSTNTYELPKDPKNPDKDKDHDNWIEMIESIPKLGLEETFRSVFRILAAILLLGNLVFSQPENDNSNATCSVSGKDVESIAKLLDLQTDQVQQCLTTNQRIISNKPIDSPMTKNDCENCRDSWAKDLYERIFNSLVVKLNETIKSNQEEEKEQSIGLLDIYGFEVFDRNGFEQLMINYTNEKLHQLYIQYVFKEEKQVFIQQNLEQFCGQIKYSDNQQVIDLLDSKTDSIFSVLDQSSVSKTDDDTAYINKQRRASAKSSHFKNPKIISDPLFTIVHTAKDVTYNSDGLREKNNDLMNSLTLKVANTSKDPFMKMMYQGSLEEKVSKTLIQKLRRQMDELMKELNSCDVHFIRCIKPNDTKLKQCMVQDYTLKQIRYLGVLDSLRVRKINYPIRRVYKQLYKKYGDMLSTKPYDQLVNENANFRDLTIDLFKKFLPQLKEDKVLFGNTHLFLMNDVLPLVQSKYQEVMEPIITSAINTQRIYRLQVLLRQRAIIRSIKQAVKLLKKLFDHNLQRKWIKKWDKTAQKLKQIEIFRGNINDICDRNRQRKRLIRWYKNVEEQKRMEMYQKQIVFLQQVFLRAGNLMRYERSLKIIIQYQRAIKAYLKLKKIRRSKICMSSIQLAIDNAWSIIREKKTIIIQRYSRGYLFRKKNKKLIDKVKDAMRHVKIKRIVVKIQKHIRGFLVRQRQKKYHKAAYLIQGYFRMKNLSEVFQRMRKNIVVIQRKVREYLKYKHFLRDQYDIYVEPLVKNLQESRYINTQHLYPSEASKIDRGFQGLSPFMNILDVKQQQQIPLQKKKMIELIQKKSSIDELLMKDIENQVINPRILLFAFVIDLEMLVDVNEIFQPSLALQYRQLFEQQYSSGQPIQTIHVGSEHIMVSTVHSKIYAWGSNHSLQCGNQQQQILLKPTLIPINMSGARPVQVSVGQDHSLLLSSDGIIYGCGCNQFSQLITNKTCSDMKSIALPSKVKQITTTLNTSFALCEDGCVFTWPVKNHSNKFLTSPLNLGLPFGVQVQFVSAGNQFAILHTTAGNLYSFGENFNGELGLGDTQSRITPTLIAKNIKWEQVSCGFKHTVAKSTLGTAYVWGCGQFGQLGTGNLKNLKTPTEIYGCLVSNVCAAYRTTIILLDTKNALWCGTNNTIKEQTNFISIKLKSLSQNLKDPNFSIVRINSTFSRTISIIYLTMANHRYMFKNNPGMERKVISQLTQKWNEIGTTVNPPLIPNISKHIAEKHSIISKVIIPKKDQTPSNVATIHNSSQNPSLLHDGNITFFQNQQSSPTKIISMNKVNISSKEQTLNLFDSEEPDLRNSYSQSSNHQISLFNRSPLSGNSIYSKSPINNKQTSPQVSAFSPQQYTQIINYIKQTHNLKIQKRGKKIKVIRERLAQLKNTPSTLWTHDDQEFLKNIYSSDLSQLLDT